MDKNLKEMRYSKYYSCFSTKGFVFLLIVVLQNSACSNYLFSKHRFPDNTNRTSNDSNLAFPNANNLLVKNQANESKKVEKELDKSNKALSSFKKWCGTLMRSPVSHQKEKIQALSLSEAKEKLALAIEEKNKKLVKILLKYKSNPYEASEPFTSKILLDVIDEAICKIGLVDIDTIHEKLLKIFSILLPHPVFLSDDLSTPGKNGMTPLHYLTRFCKDEHIWKIILEKISLALEGCSLKEKQKLGSLLVQYKQNENILHYLICNKNLKIEDFRRLFINICTFTRKLTNDDASENLFIKACLQKDKFNRSPIGYSWFSESDNDDSNKDRIKKIIRYIKREERRNKRFSCILYFLPCSLKKDDFNPALEKKRP